MSDVLNCSPREALGTSNTRRLRRSGSIPAVLYGHGKDNVSLAIPAEDIDAAIRHGAKLVDLQGAVSEAALISEVQWDAFGSEVLHLDLIRVNKDERIETTVTVELRGIAPGTKEGGVLKHSLHTVTIDCPVVSIPDKLELNINGLEKDGSLSVSDIVLPEGAKMLTSVDEVVVTCAEPEEEAEPAEGAAAAMMEPEVIGRKADDEEEGEG